VLGVVLLAVGIVVFVLSKYTDLILGRSHSTIPFGGLGLAVLGALIAVGGAMMGKAGAKRGEFKCATCGAVFGSQTALDQHTKDKHGK
jgi:hypothetical protein